MTKFHTTTLLPTDLAAAYDAMIDEAVSAQKYESLGNTEVTVETTEQAAGHRIHARRKVALDLPGFMTKIMSPTNVYDQVDVWTPAVDGEVKVTVPFVGGMAGGFAADQATKVATEEGAFLKSKFS